MILGMCQSKKKKNHALEVLCTKRLLCPRKKKNNTWIVDCVRHMVGDKSVFSAHFKDNGYVNSDNSRGAE